MKNDQTRLRGPEAAPEAATTEINCSLISLPLAERWAVIAANQ